MNIEKLIDRLSTESLYADKASLEIMELCMEAATALSTLQAENEKLRAELKQVKTERDAAVEDIAGILAKAELIRREIGYRLDYESDNKLADLCIDYCKNNVCVRCYEEREDGGCNNFLWRGLKED